MKPVDSARLDQLHGALSLPFHQRQDRNPNPRRIDRDQSARPKRVRHLPQRLHHHSADRIYRQIVRPDLDHARRIATAGCEDRTEIEIVGEDHPATGFGVSWVSPVGPLKFNFAFPLNAKTDDKKQRFQFQLGQTF